MNCPDQIDLGPRLGGIFLTDSSHRRVQTTVGGAFLKQGGEEALRGDGDSRTDVIQNGGGEILGLEKV